MEPKKQSRAELKRQHEARQVLAMVWPERKTQRTLADLDWRDSRPR